MCIWQFNDFHKTFSTLRGSLAPLHLPDPGGDVLEGAVEGGPGVGGGARQARHLAGGGLGLGAGGLLVGRHPLLQDDVGPGQHLDRVGEAVCERKGRGEEEISAEDFGFHL